jgi:hypothetical protein
MASLRKYLSLSRWCPVFQWTNLEPTSELGPGQVSQASGDFKAHRYLAVRCPLPVPVFASGLPAIF